jgi:hypothetical protein
MRRSTIASLIATLVATTSTLIAADWKPAKAPLMTTWGETLNPGKVWEEYPRPQMVRPDWQNLNGLWDVAVTDRDAAQPVEWNGQILVPFALESALSGVGRLLKPEEALWYHRQIKVGKLKSGQRALLHFGGVDWDATVWVNGKPVGSHQGMNAAWSCDITDALAGKTDAEIVVKVLDPTEAGGQPRGKQSMTPKGCFYTRVSGIWQPVWIEAVPERHITSLLAEQVATLDGVDITVQATGGAQPVSIVVSRKGKTVAKASGKTGECLALKVKAPELWSPGSPALYDVKATLASGDTVAGYTAIRWCEMKKDEQGINRLFLNGRPVFQFGPLDQGWWPDGLLTPPSDAAMRYDLGILKKMGCNMLRKHIKVENARYYYACDQMGMLVWQDFPSGNCNRDEAARENFRRESKEIVDQLRGFPSIVTWVIFNEDWGQFDAAGTRAMTTWLDGCDPRRLIISASGWNDYQCGDIADKHSYPGPAMLPVEPNRVSVLGEFGGLGLPVETHLWLKTGWGYQSFNTREDLEKRYRRLFLDLRRLVPKGLAAAVYTQTTDVEAEVNGYMTYDRKVVKFDLETLAKIHGEIEIPLPEPAILLPAADTKPGPWQYTTTKPAADWITPAFDDAAWTKGTSGFGTAETPGSIVKTTWNTPDIWLRRTVRLPGKIEGKLELMVHHDEDAEIYIDGVLAATLTGYTSAYESFALTPEAAAKIKPGAEITIAVHCHQTRGGQYIDVGIAAVK